MDSLEHSVRDSSALDTFTGAYIDVDAGVIKSERRSCDKEDV